MVILDSLLDNIFKTALSIKVLCVWFFYFTSLHNNKNKSHKVVKKNLMEKMVVREGDPPLNDSEESKNEDNIDLNELNEQIRQAVEEVDEEDHDEDFDEEGEWESHDYNLKNI